MKLKYVLVGAFAFTVLGAVINGTSGEAPSTAQSPEVLEARDRLSDKCKSVSDAEALAIQGSRLFIGMSAIGVECSWGKPRRVNKIQTKHSTSEQYVYDGQQYVYLTDGVVDAISN